MQKFVVLKFYLLTAIVSTLPFFGTTQIYPKLNFAPSLTQPKGSTLIWVNGLDSKNYKPWVDNIDNFLKIYEDKTDDDSERNRVNCDHNNPPQVGNACQFDLKWKMGRCSKEFLYDYDKGAPCVFLTLSNVYGWKPQFYNRSSELPENMPNELKEKIQSIDENDKRHEMIWVSCEGENPADTENLGPINYYPQRGFPGYFFPFMNQKGYMPPLMAIHFERPRSGVLIFVVCKLWTPDLTQDISAKFQLMYDWG